MTQESIVSYDPGLVTGVAQGVFSDTEPLRVLGGVALTYDEIIEGFSNLLEVKFDHVVSEKFVARTDNSFVPDLTPVRWKGSWTLLMSETSTGVYARRKHRCLTAS